ncbi:MAG: HAD-IC family P-type ATPase, partial [Planctomycetota bacterium]
MKPTLTWHAMTTEKTYEHLHTSNSGLSSDEVAKRINEYGPNELKETKKKNAFQMFLDQFKDFMILILILSAIISGILGDLADTISIIVILVLNAVIGFVQEYRAEKAMEALKRMASPTATVLRGGHTSSIPSSGVVPGDLVLLEAGRVVPADLRIIESAQLKVEEAALTGESVPVEKHTAPLQEEKSPLGDRKNMAYKGTLVSYGRGKGIVIATGMASELGKIATMLQTEDEVKTPLQKRLTAFGERLAYIVLVICTLFFGIGVLKGESPILMLLTAISLAVAAIPEALPAVVTISLAIGAKNMVKQNALIRKLPAVETLGSVTYICSDKTGTLTLNKMTVEEIYVDGKILRNPEVAGQSPQSLLNIENPLYPMMAALALSHDALLNADGSLIGDPTETALLSAAEKMGFHKKAWEEHYPRVSELPFDSDRKMMTTIHKLPSGKYFSFTKGGLEVILERCSNILYTTGKRKVNR